MDARASRHGPRRWRLVSGFHSREAMFRDERDEGGRRALVAPFHFLVRLLFDFVEAELAGPSIMNCTHVPRAFSWSVRRHFEFSELRFVAGIGPMEPGRQGRVPRHPGKKLSRALLFDENFDRFVESAKYRKLCLLV